MEALILISFFIAIILFIVMYFYRKNKNKTITALQKSRNNLTETLSSVYAEKFKQQEYNIERREKLHNQIDNLEKQVLELENTIDFKDRYFDDIMEFTNNSINISNFISELHSNLFNIDKYIERTKDKRTKEYKEVINQKKLLLTYIESVNNQFEEDNFDIELLNNYKSLNYKDLIVFDDSNYVFSLNENNNLICLSNCVLIENCVPDEIDNSNEIDIVNFISKKEEEFLKDKGLTHDAKVIDKINI